MTFNNWLQNLLAHLPDIAQAAGVQIKDSYLRGFTKNDWMILRHLHRDPVKAAAEVVVMCACQEYMTIEGREVVPTTERITSPI